MPLHFMRVKYQSTQFDCAKQLIFAYSSETFVIRKSPPGTEPNEKIISPPIESISSNLRLGPC